MVLSGVFVFQDLRLRALRVFLHDHKQFIVEPRKLEHGFRRIRARILYTLP